MNNIGVDSQLAQQQLKTINFVQGSSKSLVNTQTIQNQILITNSPTTTSSPKMSTLSNESNNTNQQNPVKPQSIIVLTPTNRNFIQPNLNGNTFIEQNVQLLAQQLQQHIKSSTDKLNIQSSYIANNSNLQQKLYFPVTSTFLTQFNSPNSGSKLKSLQFPQKQPEQATCTINGPQTVQYVLSANNEFV